MEGLSSKQAAAVDLHKESLRDIEEYFGVKGLQTNAATVTYKRHTNTLHKFVQAAAAAHSAGGGPSLAVCVHSNKTKTTKGMPAPSTGQQRSKLSLCCHPQVQAVHLL